MRRPSRSTRRLPQVVERINQFRPDVLWGYTTALKMLGEEQRAGRLDIKPVAVAATGEMVTTADMQFLSAAFGGAGRFQHLCLYRTHDVGDFEPGTDNHDAHR